MNQDERGSEIIASKVIKRKSAESNEKTFTLATPGNNLVVQKVQRVTRSKALLSADKPLSSEQFSKTIAGLNLTGSQSKQYATNFRMLHGRKSLEPYTIEKLHQESKRFEDFFHIVGCKLDHTQLKVRKLGHKVNRHVFVCNDLKKLISHVADARAYGGLENTYLKLAVDGGQNMLKFCFTLQLLDSSETPPPKSKPRSYAKGPFAEKFLDSGVKRLIIVGNTEEVCT